MLHTYFSFLSNMIDTSCSQIKVAALILLSNIVQSINDQNTFYCLFVLIKARLEALASLDQRANLATLAATASLVDLVHKDPPVPLVGDQRPRYIMIMIIHSRYIAVSFIQRNQKLRLYLIRQGEVWDVFCEFKAWRSSEGALCFLVL